jgi:hypothetical protein
MLMNIIEKANEVNGVMKDINLTLQQKIYYIDTLSEQELRGIFKEMMSYWASND